MSYKVKDKKVVKGDNDEVKTTEVEMTPDKALEDAKGKFNTVVVVGVTENGTVDISTNYPQYPILHWLLNRAVFELNLYERAKSAQNNGS